jgi:membrane fusion protein, multidrug efflux system
MPDAVMSETKTVVGDPVQKQGLRISTIVKWVAILVVLAAIAIGASQYFSYSTVRESTDDAQIDGHIYPVSAMVDGTLLDVLVDNNQVVQAGAVLGHIDPRFYQAALEKARGDLAEAVATERERRAGVPIMSIDTSTQLSGAEAGVAEQTAKIATAQQEVSSATVRLTTAQARVREAQANAAKADSDLARMKPLVAKEEISRQQYDAVVASAATAAAAADSAASLVREAAGRRQVGAGTFGSGTRAYGRGPRPRGRDASGPEQVAAKQALAESSVGQIQQKEAAVKQAEIDLEYTTLRAAVSGLVSQRSMEPGQTVTHGQALVAIVPLDDVWVTANFKESQLARMRPGQPVEIEVDAYGGSTKATWIVLPRRPVRDSV